MPLFFGAGRAPIGRSINCCYGTTHSVGLDNTGKTYPFSSEQAEQKKKQKILRPALLRGREWCVHHLPKSRHLHPWVVRLRAACFDACRLVWRGPGRAGQLPCGRLHGAAWLEAAARERGRRQGAALGDE